MTTTDPNTTGIQSYEAGQVTNPTLAQNATLTPVLQQVQNGENMTGNNSQLSPTGAQANPVPQVNPSLINQTGANASQVNQNQVPGVNANGYQAAQIGQNTPQAQAAQMQVNPLDTVAGQLTQLYSQSEIGKVPTWAQGAVAQANDLLASRGLGSSYRCCGCSCCNATVCSTNCCT